MKIAAVSEDGITVSQHFGRAPIYIVMTVENGKVTHKEKRLRSAENICACHGESQSGCHGEHGNDSASEAKHAGMADAIADCQYVIARGMGRGAYISLKSRNLEPVFTDEENIDAAMQLFIEGKLFNVRNN